MDIVKGNMFKLYLHLTHNVDEMQNLKGIAWQKKERGHKLSFLEEIALDN